MNDPFDFVLCPDCLAPASHLLATTNEYCYYCSGCDIRFKDKKEEMKIGEKP